MNAGSRIGFSALVSGVSNQGVTWSVTPAQPASGSIDASSGLYVAPASVSGSLSVTVVAISVANPSRSGTVAVTLVSGGGVTSYMGALD